MISSYYKLIVNRLVALNRVYKNILLFFVDYLILVFSLYFSLSIRINSLFQVTEDSLIIIFTTPIFAIPILYIFGQYSSLTRFTGIKSAFSSLLAMTVFSFILFCMLLIIQPQTMPVNFILIFWMTSIFILHNARFLIKWSLTLTSDKDNILIYGAGSAGRQLASALFDSSKYQPVAIIDHDTSIEGKTIGSLNIISPKKIAKIIKKKNIKEIFLAMPSISRSATRTILNDLNNHPVKIRVLPSLTEIAEGKVVVSDLKEVKIEDLLHRDIVQPDQNLLIQDINNKSILVTGAGGSIGSELCRQIIKLRPSRLVLFDISEASLYLIERELREYNSGINILAMIGDVTRQNRLDYILNHYEINTIYHAAAYKHVPLVEKNTIPGIRCNIFGTLALIQAAIHANVESFVFISTDKAVRPTNVMGATKRFAELILQSIAKEDLIDGQKRKTRISMVRFGNVLGSSGSVVPLFRRQIKEGGPITVTNAKVIRYFMTIPEAAQLVIQAGSIGIDGDIFLLDMGEPIQVLDLAKDMIRLSGMTINDDQNPEGDIKISFTGLRPGEKLYEELLIDEKSVATKHDKIMRAEEKGIEWDELEICISKLEQAIIESDFNKIREIFLNTVTGYNPEEKINEYL